MNKKKLTRWGIVLLVVAVIGGLVYWSKQVETAPPSENTSDLLTVSEDDWKKGPENPEAVVVEYLDFQCPSCGLYYPITKSLFEEYGDRVQFVVRHLPLSQLHRNALPAAYAAEAAGVQVKFWEMHDKLFENQEEWSNSLEATDIFAGYAEDLGLQVDKFKTDMDSDAVKQRVKDDLIEANELKLTGTPSFFVNGEQIGNPQGLEAFKQILDNTLQDGAN